MTDAVAIRWAERSLFIQLTRPSKRNALTSDMIDAMRDAVAAAEAEGAIVIVISGEPGYFSAGADIAGYRDAAHDPEALSDFTARAKALCVSLTTARAIVVAAVDGVAMGGGFEIVLAADLVVASDRSRFALPEIALGLIPGWGGTQRLTRFLGPNRTKEAVLLGGVMTAAEAHDLGVVNRVVAAGDLDGAVDELVTDLLARAPLALAAGKRAITQSFDAEQGASRGSDLETALLLELFASHDGAEGVAAFVGKRAPRFIGR